MVQHKEYLGHYLEEFDTFEKDFSKVEPDWFQDIRKTGIKQFEEQGFPTARRGNEPWKYTNTSPIAKTLFLPRSINLKDPFGFDSLVQEELSGIQADTFVFVDGRYRTEFSMIGKLGQGPIVLTLQDAIKRCPEILREHIGKYADNKENGFISLNSAFFTDGMLIFIPDNYETQRPLNIIFISSDFCPNLVNNLRVLVVTGENSKLSYMESYISLNRNLTLNNTVTEIFAGKNSEILHHRALRENAEGFHIGMTRVWQDASSFFQSTSIGGGSALTRNDYHVVLGQPDSTCILNGLHITDRREHVDNHITVSHLEPRTTSRQNFKSILSGESRSVFSGKICVQRTAEQSDAQQSDKNLILSKGAEVDSNPSLEILTDDVKCTHGATSGEISEEGLFYIMSRGFDKPTAQNILIRAFGEEIIDNISDSFVKTYFSNTIFEGLLPKGVEGIRGE